MSSLVQAALAPTILDALPNTVGLTEAELAEVLTPPPSIEMGDVALPCFSFARVLRRSPAQISRDLAEGLSGVPALAGVRATGPYLNLTLHPATLAELTLSRWLSPAETPSTGKRVMVEYSQPNSHKALHVGHLRNVCIGDALVRMLRGIGHEVVSANYFGDIGTHVAKCLWWLDRQGGIEAAPATRKGTWLGERYAQSSQWLANATEEERLEASKAISAVLRALEAREPEVTALWEETKEWSINEFRDAYGWLGAEFDLEYFESDVDEESLEMVEGLLAEGKLVESNGAVGILNPEMKDFEFFMLRKGDGTGLYSTKDLALARRKFADYKLDESIYVVDVRQSDHFRHVFLSIDKLDIAPADRCHHVAYEMVTLPEGAMSSRTGNVEPLSELRDGLASQVRARLLQRDHEWKPGEMEETVRRIAVAALRYGMLVRDLTQKIVFEKESWLDPRGNTGPYLQYAQLRMAGIVQRLVDEGHPLALEIQDLSSDPPSASRIAHLGQLLVEPEARSLMLSMDRLPLTLEMAAARLRPELLCRHLYDLAKAANKVFEKLPVAAVTGDLKDARLLLVAAAAASLKEGMALVGIQTVRRM
jgi:arginyl-tRNA synthetase